VNFIAEGSFIIYVIFTVMSIGIHILIVQYMCFVAIFFNDKLEE
jgi:hypothetical protein